MAVTLPDDFKLDPKAFTTEGESKKITLPEDFRLDPHEFKQDNPWDAGIYLSEQAEPEKVAADSVDDWANNIAFGIPSHVSAPNRSQIMKEVNSNWQDKSKKDAANRLLKEFSAIGLSYPYSQKDKQQFKTDEEVIAEAEKYRTAGLITDKELENVKTNPDDFRSELWATPAASYFYDQSIQDKINEGIDAFSVGAISTFQGYAGFAQYLGGDTVAGRAANSIRLQLKGTIEEIAPRPSFGMDVISGFGSMGSMLVTTLGSGTVVKGVAMTTKIPAVTNFVRSMSAYLDMTGFAVNEAVIEAGMVAGEATDEGKNMQEVNKATRFTFFSNVALGLVTNRLGLFSSRFRKMNALHKQHTGKELAEAGVKGFTGEFAQEATQTAISETALERPVKLDDMLYSGFIGGIVGGPTSILMTYANKKIEAITPLSPESQANYDADVAENVAKGATLEQAHVEATRNLSQTVEGETYIESVADAADAVFMADASMGGKITADEIPASIIQELRGEELAPEATPRAGEVTEERIDVLVNDEALTDEQIARAIETELEAEEAPVMEEAEQGKTVEEKISLIKESMPTAISVEQASPETIEQFGIPAKEAFEAKMPNGSTITVFTGAEIDVTAENIETIRKDYVKPGLMTEEDLQSGNFVVLGKNQAIGENGIIALVREGETAKVLNEELYELAEKTVLTPEEIQIVEAEYGSFEERSKAYAADTGSQQVRTLWQKIQDFFRNIRDYFKKQTTAKEVFGRVRKGEVFERKPRTGEETETFNIENFTPVWYSTLEKEIASEQFAQKGTGKSYAATIRGWISKGKLKQEEVEWTGLLDYLDALGDEKITKSDVLTFVKDNGVQVEETTLGSQEVNVAEDDFERVNIYEDAIDVTDSWELINPEQFGDLEYVRVEEITEDDGTTTIEANINGNVGYSEKGSFQDFLNWFNSQRPSVGDTKFSKYQLPGGENYKELLLKLPVDRSPKPPPTFEEFFADAPWGEKAGKRLGTATDEELAKYRRLYEEALPRIAKTPAKPPFTSSHFDDPNILAHVRFNERVDENGNKVLFIEEIQSDWHQAGRKQGYGGKVPDAPFKKTWPQLALKRMVRLAAENGFDSIAWTTGEQQTERYDLSKQVDSIIYKVNEDGSYQVSAQISGRGQLLTKNGMPDDLTSIVGKEVAERIVGGVGEEINLGGAGTVSQPKDIWRSLAGVDLKVGGEGMKGFYDKILPAAANKLFNKSIWGNAKVDIAEIEIEGSGKNIYRVYDANGNVVYIRDADGARPFGTTIEKEAQAKAKEVSGTYSNELSEDITSVHALPVTAEMKDIVLREGLPTFSIEKKPEKIVLSQQAKAELRERIKVLRTAMKEKKEDAIKAERASLRKLIDKSQMKITVERLTRKETANLLTELPVALRGKFSKALANAKTPKDFGDLNQRIINDITAFRDSEVLRKKLGTQRSKIAYIRMIGEFNQTVINEIKAEVGLDKPLKEATEEQLNAITDKLKARLRFKTTRGYRPQIKDKASPRTDIRDDIYDLNRSIVPSRKEAFLRKANDAIEEAGKTADVLLGTVSTRLANINPKLRTAIRDFEFRLLTKTQADTRASVPFLKKLKGMSREDYADLDFALKNGDTNKINELADKYEMQDEFKNVRKMLDDIYKRANDVGYDIGYRENYFPRQLKDSAGFLEFMSEREDWSILGEAIKRKELALGRTLDVEEKANLINTMIRGYSGGQISLSATGNMKDRVIDFVTPEMNQYYEDSASVLLSYIDSVNNAIEARRFFGKEKVTGPKEDQFGELEDSLGAYIEKLMREGMITPAQEKEIRSIMLARFNQKGTHGIVGIAKNVSYLSVMGSYFNAITQLGDLSFAIYAAQKGTKGTGMRDFLPAFVKAALNKSTITKEDLGIERIAQEVQEKSLMANMVDRTFRIVGLTKMDTIGKETLINSVVTKYMRLAKENDPKLIKSLEDIFGDEAGDVLEDLKTNTISENVKFLAFNEVLNFQPMALSEVPEKYLNGGNGRIFYMLKTWTIKMFDVYRNEIYIEYKTDPIQATKNMVTLASLLTLMNASADVLKDLLLGREIDLDDVVVDNIVKLIGFSRYATNQIKRKGLGTVVMEQILPPTKLVDDVSRDVLDLYKSFKENKEVDKLRTPENIPVVGKLYYWWFGRGSERKKKHEKPKKQTRRTRE